MDSLVVCLCDGVLFSEVWKDWDEEERNNDGYRSLYRPTIHDATRTSPAYCCVLRVYRISLAAECDPSLVFKPLVRHDHRENCLVDPN
jgi:hypothetical protein